MRLTRTSLGSPPEDAAPVPSKASAAPAVCLRVPAEAAQRAAIAALAAETVAEAQRTEPAADLDARADLDALDRMAEGLIEHNRLDANDKGFAMLAMANALNLPGYAATAFSRRLLMLPRCLARDPMVAALRARAEELGYRVLMADGTPAVVSVLAAGDVDAICGVACMDSLTRVFSVVRQLGAPAVAAPLLSEGCRQTHLDPEMLSGFIEADDAAAKNQASTASTPSNSQKMPGYLGVLRLGGRLFEPEALRELIARRLGLSQAEADDATHLAALDWLATGGKRLRPFIALAAAAAVEQLPAEALGEEALLGAAAIEAFHKASLAHDDIQDGDEQRYGRAALHVQRGVAQAINIGDYLLGLGYRLAAEAGANAGGKAGGGAGGKAGKNAAAAEACRLLSQAHCQLARGQGEELFWRDGHDHLDNAADAPAAPADRPARLPARRDILRVYALKTAPAFEAALRLGLLLGGAGPEAAGRELTLFSRHVGVGFQLLNDVDDLDADRAAGRATYPLAAEAEGLTPAAARTETLKLVDALHARARTCADRAAMPGVRTLCRFLTDLALDHRGNL